MYVWLSNQIGASAANITVSFIFFIITITAIAAILLFLRGLKRKNSVSTKKASIAINSM